MGWESDVSTVQRSLSSKVKIKISISTNYIVKQRSEVTNVKARKCKKRGIKNNKSIQDKIKRKLYEQTGNFTSRQTVSRWAPHSDPYRPMFLCVALRKPWSVKARCPLTIGGMWMTL